MYYLGSVLQQGYLAHTVMQQAFRRTEEALDALDMSVFAENTSDAAILSNLLQGETAADNRKIYHANSAISVMQTFREGVDQIVGTLNQMSSLATIAATGVYSDLEVTALQFQFNDLARHLNRTAAETRYGPYRLLNQDEQAVPLLIGPDVMVTLHRKDLSVDTSSLDLKQDATAAITAISGFKQAATAYRDYLQGRIGEMEQQIAMADYDITQAMGYSMHLPSPTFAREVVREVVAGVTSDSLVAMQAQGRPSAATLLLAEEYL